MKNKSNSQLGPATALAQLQAEHPNLPKVAWHLAANGHLSGSAMCMTTDPRPAMAAFAEVLGGVPSETWPLEGAESRMFSVWLHVTWRDVPLSVWMGCDVSFVSESSVVAA